MPPEAERLIDLATRPLANNAELQLTAASELRREIEANAATPEDLAEAADSLARADQHPRRRYWRAALYLTTLVVSVPMLVHSMRQALGFSYVQELISPQFGSSGPLGETMKWNFSPQQKLLLLGDDNSTNRSDRWKPLWDSEPENPAYLAQYAAAFFSDHKQFSPEILDAAARIDPDNGWFMALAAGGAAEGAVAKQPQTDKEKKDLDTPEWKINDPEKLKESLSLVHQAAEKPRFNSYEADLLKQRIPLLPKRTDCVSQVPPIAYVGSQTSSIIHLRKTLDTMCAGAQECAAKQDVAGFRQIVGDWESLSRKITENGVTLIDLLVAKIYIYGPAENFRDAAQALGLDREAERFSKLHEWKKADREARRQSKWGSPSESLIATRGSLFATMTIPMVDRQVKTPPPLTDEDLRPSRYADHALFMRAISLAAMALLGLFAGFAALHRYRQNPLVRSLSARTLDLLRPSDWAWILVGGILPPLFWYLAFIYLTPLTSREWSFKPTGFLQATGQFGSMIVLMMVLSAVLATWRLAKRGAPLGLTTRFRWIGWIATLSAALAVPAFGAIMLGLSPAGRMYVPHELFLYLGCALLGIPVLWLLVGFCRNVLGSHLHAPRRATLARMVLPAWIFGMLVLAVSIPFHYAGERHWIQQDRLFEVTADAPAMSRYQWDVTQQLRKELLELMEGPGGF